MKERWARERVRLLGECAREWARKESRCHKRREKMEGECARGSERKMGDGRGQ